MKAVSQFFDINRFGYALRHDLAVAARKLILRAILMFGTIALGMYFIFDNWFINEDLGGLNVFFIFMAMIYGIISGSMFMEDYSNRDLRLNSLMLPASTFEKFLSRTVICVILTLVAYVSLFYLADFFRVMILKALSGPDAYVPYFSISDVFINNATCSSLILSYLCAQATFILGSTIWPKHPFVKTFAALFVLLVLFSFFIGYVLKSFGAFNFAIGALILERNDFTCASYVFNICYILFCYIISYFRMRESEIINRL